MTVKSLLAGVLAGMMCLSCGQNNPGASGQTREKTLAGAADTTKGSARKTGELRIPDAPVVRGPAGDNATLTESAGAGGSTAGADLSDVPLAPKDAKWTIYCATVADPSHVETSRGLKAALIKRTGMREWYILHESNQSRLYYGFYRSINDPSDAIESARAQADRKKIDELEDASKTRPFRACQFVQLSAPDPDSPPQWNLVNLPPDKVWTLMIGAYKDHPDRKKAAVEAVREARAAGEEAYYFHGDNVSNVFVGAWPDAAVIEERLDPEPEAGKGGRGDLLVLPPGVKPEGRVRDKAGRPIRAVAQRLVPVDPTLKEKIAKYPHMGVNGEFLVLKAQGRARMQGSMVVQIPRAADNLFRDNVAEAAAEANGDGAFERADPFAQPADQAGGSAPQRTKRPPDDGSSTPGRLRSIGRK